MVACLYVDVAGVIVPRCVVVLCGLLCVHYESGSGRAPLVGWAGVGLVVCVTSCEGHMVDALASRADEGRRSLR